MTRLLSPERRRIYPNPRTGTGIEGAGPIVKQQRRELEPGQPDQITWQALLRLGWVVYDGPGQVNDRGFVIPGTLEPS